ncbi:hypothetical protein [Accumulibacter sp.]|uniref:hypothetical protein n=1 Tax=Accumulibacter sp. TaxID=2053492 RepID=UPI00263A0079|nr:hypothetical protein [Accumulibacter sp.]
MGIRGVIAASDPHTAIAGAQILRHGGNAVDAIVVAELPLTPLAGRGGGVMLPED